MSEHCNNCETSMVGATLADGTSLCPNCLIMLAIGMKDGDIDPVEKDVEAGSGLECAACGALGNAAMVNDFCVDDPNRRIVKWPACAECLRQTAMLNLTPMKVKNLRAYAEGELFNTHDDFYDAYGNAVQRTRNLPRFSRPKAMRLKSRARRPQVTGKPDQDAEARDER